ncbi:hypothetical protein [Nocardioides aequoreus]|uniref:hypothetical protein n=1 Tax=Nocardioides aequoreus TaxID=397278 RepID=UPI0012F63B61|nr:hypothetical protein [Nocardioides aequoreus]
MTLDDRGPHGRPVVGVGPSSLAAGHAFGPDHDDLVLAAYDEVGATHDLDHAASVHLLVAPGCEAALASLVERLGPGSDLTLAAEAAHHDLLLDLLQRHGLAILGVRGRTRGVSFHVAPGQPDPARDRLLLQAVAAASSATAEFAQPTRAPRRQNASPTPSRARQVRRRTREAAPPPRPVPPLVRALDRVSGLARGRRRTAALGVLGFVALVLLVVALFAATGSAAGSSLLVLLLGGGAVALAGASLLGVLLLARQLHRQTARLEEALRQHEISLRQHERRIAKRDVVAAGDTALTHDYLAAIAAASAVQGRDLQIALEDLARERRA